MDNNKLNNKIIAKNSFYLYFRLIISLFISLYTSRIILNALGVEDYGIYNIVGGFVSMLALFTSSITSAANRFIAYELGKGDKVVLKETFSTLVMLLFIMAIAIFILGEILGLFFFDRILNIPSERIETAYFVFHLSLLTFCINLISVPYTAAVTAHEKINFFAIVSIFESVSKLIIVYILYISPFDKLKSYTILLALIGLIIRLIYGIYCNKKFEETHVSLHLNKKIFTEIFSYSFWVSIGASSSLLKEQGINILINIFFGVTMNAARGVSMQVYSAVGQFANNIGTAINPQITKSFAAGDLKRSINLTLALIKLQGIILLIFSIPLFLEMEYILKIWLGNVPYYAVTFSRWVLILCYARTLESTHVPLFLATGKVRNLQILGGGIMLLNIPVSYLFLRWGYEPVSTMIIGTIIELITMIIAFIYLKQIIGFPLHRLSKEVLGPLAITIVLSLIIPLAIKFYFLEEGPFRLIILTIVSIISSCAFSYLIVFNKREKNLIATIIKNKIKK